MMAPTCFGTLGSKWRSIVGSAPCEPCQTQQQPCQAKELTDHQLMAALERVASADPKAADPTTRQSTHQRAAANAHSVPLVPQAALNERLHRVSERVAVVSVYTPPPQKGASDLASWCTALHVSESLQSLLGAHSPSDYMDFIQALVETSGPGLQEALVQCGQHAWQAQTEPGLPDNDEQQLDGTPVTVPTQGLEFEITLILTPMLIQASGAGARPALFIEHLVEHHEATLEQQLRYKDMLLSRAPAILTICDLQGNVLHQNAASIQYAGNRTPPVVPTSGPSGPADNYLQQTLQHEPESLHQLLEEIGKGQIWSTACAKVPATLKSPTLRGSVHCPSNQSILGGFNFSGSTEATSRTEQIPAHRPAQALALAKSWDPASPHNLAAKAAIPPSPYSIPQSLSPLHSSVTKTWDAMLAGPAIQGPETPASPSVLRLKKQASQLSQPQATLLPLESPVSATSSQAAGMAQDVSVRSGNAYLAKQTSLTGGYSSRQMEAVPLGSTNSIGTNSGFKPSRLNMLIRSSATPLLDGSHDQSGGGADYFPGSSNHIAWQDLLTLDNWTGLDDGCPGDREVLVDHADIRAVHSPGEDFKLESIVGSKSAPSLMKPPSMKHGNHEPLTSWHEIKAWPTVDPTTGATLVVISQVDVTERMESDARMSQVSEACVSLLELIFPRHVIEHLAVNSSLHSPVDAVTPRLGTGSLGSNLAAGAALDQLATKHECVTLFFCDIVGFTSMSKEVEPVQVMQFLNSLYSAYDQLVDEFGVYKVETVGDCYVVAGGLMTQDEEGFACVDREGRNDGTSHALAVYRFAQAVLQVAANTPMPHNGQPVQIRIGLHSGPITSGIIGHRMPKFCLFGDSMNTCSRMETTAPYGSIHLSQATYDLLAQQRAAQGLVCTGGVEVKGKGLMITYVYTPKPEPAPQQPPRFPLSLSGRPPVGDTLIARAPHEILLAEERADLASMSGLPARSRMCFDAGVPNGASASKWSDTKDSRPTSATRPSCSLQALCSAAVLQPSYQRSADERSSTLPKFGPGSLLNPIRQPLSFLVTKAKGPYSGSGGQSSPTPLRSASPTSNLLRVVSTLHQQQTLARVQQTSEPIYDSSRSGSTLTASRSNLRSSQSRSLLKDSAALATLLSNLQLPEPRSSSSARLSSIRLPKRALTAGSGVQDESYLGSLVLGHR